MALGLSLCVMAASVSSGSPLDPARPSRWQLPRPDLYAVTAESEHVWAVGYWGTVIWSDDAGDSWSYGVTPVRETLFDVDFADAEHGWAVGARGTVLRSTDGGRNWSAQQVLIEDEFGDAEPLDSPLFGLSAVSKTEAWAVGDFGRVLHTTDGESWEVVAIPEQSFGDDNLPDRILNAVRFADSQDGWIAGEFGTLLRTRDAGATWTAEPKGSGAPSDLYLFALAVSDPGSDPSTRARAAVGLAGTVLLGRERGEAGELGPDWVARTTPTRAALFAAALRDQRMVLVGDRGVVLTSFDAGATWEPAEHPRLFGWLGGVTYLADARVIAVGADGAILRSEDGGRRFERVKLQSQGRAASMANGSHASRRDGSRETRGDS